MNLIFKSDILEPNILFYFLFYLKSLQSEFLCTYKLPLKSFYAIKTTYVIFEDNIYKDV